MNHYSQIFKLACSYPANPSNCLESQISETQISYYKTAPLKHIRCFEMQNDDYIHIIIKDKLYV